jgi:hypothetical protein
MKAPSRAELEVRIVVDVVVEDTVVTADVEALVWAEAGWRATTRAGSVLTDCVLAALTAAGPLVPSVILVVHAFAKEAEAPWATRAFRLAAVAWVTVSVHVPD